MKNTIWVFASLLVVLFISSSCERELVDPDTEIQISDNATSNYIRWDSDDDLDAAITETSPSSATLTLESLPYNSSTFDVTYEISGIPSIDGANTVTFPARDFEFDVDIAIPENALGEDGSLSAILDTAMTGAITRTLIDTATISITSVTNGLTIGRGGSNANALGEELDPVSVILIVTQVDTL
jgi:hypothetical protein